MSQNNRIFDDLGRLMNEAAGVADGVRREVETAVKSQAQRFVVDMKRVFMCPVGARWPRPMGTMASMDFNPVCTGWFTD